VKLPLHDADHAVACAILQRHELGLRAGDALHIAIAIAQRLSLCTMDRKVQDGAAALGVDVTTPS
jgi:uncharacterized protein